MIPKGNALYIELKQADPANTKDLEEGITADLDGDGHIIGIEILGALERLGEQTLASISYELLVPENDPLPSVSASDQSFVLVNQLVTTASVRVYADARASSGSGLSRSVMEFSLSATVIDHPRNAMMSRRWASPSTLASAA